MAQDDFAAELKRRRQQAPTSDSFQEVLAKRRQAAATPSPEEPEPKAPSQSIAAQMAERQQRQLSEGAKKDVARLVNVLSGIPLAEDIAGAVTGMLPGGMSRQQGRQAAARAFKQAEQRTGPIEAAVERAIPMAVATRGLSLLPMAGAVVGGEALRGFGAAGTAEGAEAPTIGQRVSQGAKAGAGAAGGMALVEGALRVPGAARAVGAPVVRAIGRTPYAGPLFRGAQDIAEGMAGGLRDIVQPPLRTASTFIQQRVAPAVEPYVGEVGAEGVRRLGQAIAPRDMQRVLSEAEQRLPGRAGSAPLGRLQRQAEQATAQVQQLKEAGEAAGERLSRFKEKGQRLEKEAAEITIARLEQKAQARFGQLASPQESATAMRQTILDDLSETGQRVYQSVQQVKPLKQVPVRAYQQISKSQPLSSAFDYAVEAKRQRLFDANVQKAIGEGVPITEAVKRERIPQVTIGKARNPATGEEVEVKRPALDLEIFDYMDRWVNERVEAGLSGDASGITRSQAKILKGKIDTLREDWLNAHDPAARQVLRAARGEMRGLYEDLDLVRDGLNLQRFSLSAPAQMRESGTNDLTELITDVSKLPAEKRKFFEIPARRSIANLVQQRDQSVGAIAEALVGTTQAKKRTALALGDQTVAELEQFLPARIQAASAKKVQRVTTVAERGVKAREAEAERIAESLRQARDVEERATFAAGIPFEQILAGGQPSETFRTLTAPRLRQDLRADVLGSLVQDKIRGMSPSEAMRYLEEVRRNPAIAQEFGGSIQQTLQAIRQPGPLRTGAQRTRQLLTGQTFGRQ
jgi:hypothetical protein